MKYPAPTPKVIGGHPAKHSGTGNFPIRHVVIHSAVMPCEPDRARQLAAWNRDGVGGGSWHYAVDPDEVIQCSYDSYVVWCSPPNGHKLEIEMADNPVLGRARWKDDAQHAMLERTARLTAEALLANDLPVRFVGRVGLRLGRRGVTTHAAVSKAFGQSTHWDPGAWPRRRFMRRVRHYTDEIRAGA